MTRKEAIEVLKLVDENASCDDCLYYAQTEDCPTDEDCIIRQALEMAIQALSQEPCDDAISREKVLEMITDFATLELYIDKHNHVTFEPLEKLIKSLPSVMQKSGKWVDIPFSHYYKCSECDKYQISATNYCPNCGARMESEE